MKKFWKIKNDKYVNEKLKYINVGTDFIASLNSGQSELSFYIDSEKNIKHFYVSFNEDSLYDQKWGWGEENDYEWYTSNSYQYAGEVNLRKDKLLKINETILENKK